MGSVVGSSTGPDVIDIRRGEIKSGILDDIRSNLHAANGAEKQLPTMLLYDEKGLKLFELITFLEEYYLTNAEIEILDRYADRIADRIPSGSQLVELGSGNLRKIRILLRALDRARKEVDYYALDLSRAELARTLDAVSPGTFERVQCHGLFGTYDDGLEWLKQAENRVRPTVIMSMGSSVGNFDRAAAAAFLRDFSKILKPTDLMLVGVDGSLNKDKIHLAYNDRKGITHEFYRNGLDHANKLLGLELFKQDQWDVIGEFDERQGRHSAFVSPRTHVTCGLYSFDEGERIRIENAYKYNSNQRAMLWHGAGLGLRASYIDSSGDYSLNILAPRSMAFPLDPNVYAKQAVPSLDEFQELWRTWDLVTLEMLPRDEILSKPIYLRNCCLFYLGHIPTFLDIQLSNASGHKLTEPSNFKDVFERGVDPDVENPEKCHAHSKIPDTWPPVDQILNYQHAVRHRVKSLYESHANEDPKLGKALWLGLEHEAMHLETFLYMLLQSDKTLPPPELKPDFASLAYQGRSRSSPNDWVHVPRRTITVGKDETDGFWGWDNEFPLRSRTVAQFEAKARPITNGDYARFLIDTRSTDFPTSWTFHDPANDKSLIGDYGSLANGYSSSQLDEFLKGKAVRTVYGPVPLVHALDWPCCGSYDQLFRLADSKGCRIPTAEEAQSIYAYAEELKAMENGGSVCLDGLPMKQRSLFADLRGCNVGFENFHLLPVTLAEDKLAGLAGLGGVWEWTSSPLRRWDGFKPMEEYPAYTDDFFDGRHNICFGGSWATHPRLAGRRSFVNWYQRSYPYAWTGARLVRDVSSAGS